NQRDVLGVTIDEGNVFIQLPRNALAIQCAGEQIQINVLLQMLLVALIAGMGFGARQNFGGFKGFGNKVSGAQLKYAPANAFFFSGAGNDNNGLIADAFVLGLPNSLNKA